MRGQGWELMDNIRIQKLLADAGIGSRRFIEGLIEQGRVSLNGQVCRLGDKAPCVDGLTVDGLPVSKTETLVYYILNKPRGYVTTAKEQFGRPCVLDLVKINERVYPVGRLDYDTSGLLILTNDGDLTFKLTHPGQKVPKTYEATVSGIPTQELLDKLREGVDIGGYTTAPAQVKLLKTGFLNNAPCSTLSIIIKEGKNRQVRRMCESINHPILALKRTHIGTLGLGSLKEGSYKQVTKEEILALVSMPDINT